MNNDQKLYEEFLKGNLKAFDDLVDKYRNIVTSFINTYVKNFDISEDLAQDVFVYVLINKKEYDFKYSLKTYLYTIARSRAINYLKREKRVIYMDEYIENNISINSIDDKILLDENKRKIHKAINKLNNNQAKILYLIDIEDMSYKEVSKILNISLPQVKMTLYRARKKLKMILQKEDEKNG